MKTWLPWPVIYLLTSSIPFLYRFSNSAAPLSIKMFFSPHSSSETLCQTTPLRTSFSLFGGYDTPCQPLPTWILASFCLCCAAPKHRDAFLACCGFWHSMPDARLPGGPLPCLGSDSTCWPLPHHMDTLDFNTRPFPCPSCRRLPILLRLWTPKPSLWTLFPMVSNFHTRPPSDNLHTASLLQAWVPLSPYSSPATPCEAALLHWCPPLSVWVLIPRGRLSPCMNALLTLCGLPHPMPGHSPAWHLFEIDTPLQISEVDPLWSSTNAYLALLHWVASRALGLNLGGNGKEKTKRKGKR